MEENKMTVAESIEVISRMIRSTRHNIERTSHRPFLIWGYTTTIVALAVWYSVSTTQNHAWFLLWFAIPVIGITATYISRPRQSHKGYVRTPIDKAICCLWSVLGLAALVATIFSFVKQMDILFFIILLIASGTAITGLILQFKTLIATGIAGLLLSGIFLFTEGIDQCLTFAATFVIMNVIPGHIIQYRSRKAQ